LNGVKGSDPKRSGFPLAVKLLADPVLLGVAAFGGGATKIQKNRIFNKSSNQKIVNCFLHSGGGLAGDCPLKAEFPFVMLPLDKLPDVNKVWPKDFGGSNPNKSLVILLPLSDSSARGSKSLSESEFKSNPSSFGPTLGFRASSVLLICDFVMKAGKKIISFH
jgi:hypothetical protein